MTTLQDLRRTISHFVDDRRKRRQLEREFEQLAAMGSLDAVLADIGLAHSQIEPLIAEGARSRELLDQMLVRLGIDAAQLPVESLRDMTWTCTTCPDKRYCRRWMADTEGTDFHAFCPNAAQLDSALIAQGQAGGQRRDAPAAGGSRDGAYYPTNDDLRQMRAEASQREARALLDRAHLF